MADGLTHFLSYTRCTNETRALELSCAPTTPRWSVIQGPRVQSLAVATAAQSALCPAR